ncbi:hypothetical protein AN958_12480 [Leucoagaricus sp. SymC.cos]|nr:hypothetical protein AN958_12480 [Leucoagaricus sp. SymC.cos]
MRLSAITELPLEMITTLEEQGIKTDADFLSVPLVDVLLKLPPGKTTLGQLNDYRELVSRASSAPGIPAEQLMGRLPETTSTKHDIKWSPSLLPVSGALTPFSGRVIEIAGHGNSRKSEFVLNIVLLHVSSNARMTAYWVDTIGEISTGQASNIVSGFSEDGGMACLERMRWSLVMEAEHIYDVLDEAVTFDGVGYLVIDKITTLLGPLLATSSSQGHVWMTELMHHLRVIAQTHSITILVRCLIRCTFRLTHVFFVGMFKIPALGPTFTFLTDATLWSAYESESSSWFPRDSRLLAGDYTAYRLEVLKANFMASGAAGIFVLRSDLHLLLEI